MQGPDLIFTITNENFQFYQPDKDGLLVVNSNPYFFQFSPDGWYDVAVNNIRNKTYWAIDRSVSIPLDYFGDGARVLKSIVMTMGTEAKAYLTICSQQLDYVPGVDYRYWYKKEYRASIDFGSYEHTGSKVNITCSEDGLPKYLKANEGKAIELPMNVPDAVMVKMDGINLRNKLTYGIPGVETSGKAYITGSEYETMPISLLTEEGNTFGVEFLSVNVQQFDSSNIGVVIIGSDNYMAINKGTLPVTFTINGSKRFACTAANEFIPSPPELVTDDRATMGFIRSDGTFYSIFTGLAPVANTPYGYTYSKTITLAPGQKLFPIRRFYRAGSSGDSTLKFLYAEDEKTDIVSITTRRPATYVPHFTGQYIYNKIIENITDSKYAASVSAFLNRNKNLLFTCGDAIRGLVDDDGNSTAVMKIMLKKYFGFWNSLYAVGLISYESSKQVNIDEKQFLSDRLNRIRLTSPATPVKIKIRKELGWNILKIGYPEIKNDVGVLNGNEAFCCGFEFNNGVLATPGELNKISEIKADCYEQEIIRIELTGKDTTDNKRDNDLYVNYVDGTLQAASGDIPAHYLLDRSLNAAATGLLEKDSVWNLKLSPKRMLLNNLSYLNSCLQLCDTIQVKYSTADKNNKVVAGGVTEKGNETLGTNGRFFYPLSMVLQTPAPKNILDLLNATPLSTVEVDINGVVYSGTPEKSSVVLAASRATEHEILLDETNVLNKLIDYNG